MKNILYTGWLVLLLLGLAACESGGKFRVINHTSFPLYVTLSGETEVVIPGGAEHIFAVDTATEHIFNPDVTKEVPLRLVGETYYIYDDYEEIYTDSTTVTIRAGETLDAHINPNCASFKVVNASSKALQSVALYRHNYVAAQLVNLMENLLPGEARFLRLDYATANNNFYYYAYVQADSSTAYTYGGPATVLEKDEQFLVTVTDPEEPKFIGGRRKHED